MRNLDIFGKPVGLTYNGKATFQTAFGGFMTLIVLLILGGIGITNFIELYIDQNYSKTTISASSSHAQQEVGLKILTET